MDPRSLYWNLPSYEYYPMSSDEIWVLYKIYTVKYKSRGSLVDPRSTFWILPNTRATMLVLT